LTRRPFHLMAVDQGSTVGCAGCLELLPLEEGWLGRDGVRAAGLPGQDAAQPIRRRVARGAPRLLVAWVLGFDLDDLAGIELDFERPIRAPDIDLDRTA